MDLSKIQELNLDDDDFLKVLYENRENKGGIITQEFKKKIEKDYTETINEYNRLEQKIKQQLKNENKIGSVMNDLDIYMDWYNNLHGLYYEQYYYIGLKDGVKLSVQCLK